MSSEFSAILPSQTRGLKVGESGPCKLFHGFSSSSLYQSSPHIGSCLELLNRSASPKRKKRKSRKLQRVLGHRAVLEQRKLLGPKKETDSSSSVEGTNRSAMLEETSWCCQSNCRCPTTSRSSHVLLDKHRINLTKLKKALSDSLSEPCERTDDQHASVRGYDSGLSLPGSSASSRPSSPCQPWTVAGKCIAMDCEMVGTGAGGKVSELARCSIVNYTGDVIYDKYIMPVLPVYDYRTRWSGITKQHMKGAIPFAVAQKEIIAILKDKLVIGHAIYHDFRALKYYHPSTQTRDTSKFPLLNQKAGLPVKATVSLKNLACSLLHKNIQVGRAGHSSVEDAFTAMELYRLVQDEWEKQIQTNMWPCLPCQPAGDLSDNERFMEDKYWPEDLNVHYT